MSSNDVVYYNLTIGNNDPAQAGLPTYTAIPAEINANNNLPIVNNPDDYYASIIRFSTPAINLPLITFLVQTPVNDINLGIYSFTIYMPGSQPVCLAPCAYTHSYLRPGFCKICAFGYFASFTSSCGNGPAYSALFPLLFVL